jgi:hypothetical protein
MAGFNTRLGTKQTLMGGALVQANIDICGMSEKMFPNWKVPVVGVATQGKNTGKPVQYEVQPKDFNGWYKTRLIFPPADPTTAYFQEMDKNAKGVQSRETTMRNIGVTNIHDELQRIKAERLEDAEHANNIGLANQGKFQSPGAAAAGQAADSQGVQDLVQKIHAMGVQGIHADGSDEKKAKKQVGLDASKQNTDGTVSKPGEPSKPAGPGGTPGDNAASISDMVFALKRAANLSGRGSVTQAKDGTFNISLENPQDQAAVKLALGPLASKVSFTVADFSKPLPENSISFSDPSKKGAKAPSGKSADDNAPDPTGVSSGVERSILTKETKKKSIQRAGVGGGPLDENAFPIDLPTN